MKDTRFLYSIATLALGSIIAIFASYATNTLPTSTPRHSSSVVIAATPAKKNCGCCPQMIPQELKTFRERNEKLRKQRQTYQKVAKLIIQYGREEGLRRLKQSDPEIAAQLEHVINKYSIVTAH